MAIHTVGFTVYGEPAPVVHTVGLTIYGELQPVQSSSNAINIFPAHSGDGGYNLDGMFTSIGSGPGDPPPPPPPYNVLLTLSPAQREPGQGSALKVEVMLGSETSLNQYTVQLSSSNQAVSPVPSSVITDNRGVVLMEIIAMSVGVSTIGATVTIDNVVYASNQVTFVVFTTDIAENYNATGYGVIRLALENSLSRGVYPNPQRLSHEEQWNKYPGDTGLRRAAYLANVEIVFLPSFLQR